ncbi:glycosyltransferase family A protein [Leifsonia sp. NPDC080035]|uniref:Glycosyltransferase family A protein n=1 Tax=Leifsonia sp. NPDC080035 TaxID=3143936 RepID=A0AAU7GCN8_9MICO
MTPTVDVLVPVHSVHRPVARLARSVLQTSVPIRLVVVAHNVDPSQIEAALGEHRADPRVSVLAFEDGIPSPAGPLRHALERLESPFFMKIDSDDYLADGAIESWTRTQRAHDADIVIPTMRMVGTPRNFPTPPRRPFRTRLDPARDRLAYRTSTMGLIRSELAEKAIPTPGLGTAEDLIPGLRLWFSGGRIVAADARHPYMVAPDALDRVTEVAWPMEQELGFAAALPGESFWAGLDDAARIGIAAKLFRVQLVAALGREARSRLTAEDIRVARDAVRVFEELAPGFARVLSRDDARLLAELVSADADPVALADLARRSRAHLSVGGLLTPRLGDVLRRDAPLRYLGASVLARYRR